MNKSSHLGEAEKLLTKIKNIHEQLENFLNEGENLSNISYHDNMNSAECDFIRQTYELQKESENGWVSLHEILENNFDWGWHNYLNVCVDMTKRLTNLGWLRFTQANNLRGGGITVQVTNKAAALLPTLPKEWNINNIASDSRVESHVLQNDTAKHLNEVKGLLGKVTNFLNRDEDDTNNLRGRKLDDALLAAAQEYETLTGGRPQTGVKGRHKYHPQIGVIPRLNEREPRKPGEIWLRLDDDAKRQKLDSYKRLIKKIKDETGEY